MCGLFFVCAGLDELVGFFSIRKVVLIEEELFFVGR